MFEKLIEAASTCYESGNPIDECCIEGCPNFDSQPYCLDQILKDCVEALTQSGAMLADKDYLIQQQTEEIERLRRNVKKQQEKMIELAKGMPKHGEWKEWDEDTWSCSVCGEPWMLISGTPRSNGMNYCPHCGAKMEVQE